MYKKITLLSGIELWLCSPKFELGKCSKLVQQKMQAIVKKLQGWLQNTCRERYVGLECEIS